MYVLHLQHEHEDRDGPREDGMVLTRIGRLIITSQLNSLSTIWNKKEKKKKEKEKEIPTTVWNMHITLWSFLLWNLDLDLGWVRSIGVYQVYLHSFDKYIHTICQYTGLPTSTSLCTLWNGLYVQSRKSKIARKGWDLSRRRDQAPERCKVDPMYACMHACKVE